MAKSIPLTAQQIANRAEAMVVPTLAEILPMVVSVKTTPERRKILATKCLPQAVLWNKRQKAAYAEVDEKTWYNAERSPKFLQLCVDFIKEQIGANAPELWSRYIELALDGDRQALERILQQTGVLDKPEKGDTNITLTLTIEQKIELQKKRESNQSRGLEALGYTLHTDN
ncbi:hypothetical protein LCGC14_1988270 [marine sediment metagenome]|uniref:Uncharacterized protein n=1 Tax=marine sediment metagenome TaxID=412755 RepID=A0A0F9F6R3_9ZZZZ